MTTLLTVGVDTKVCPGCDSKKFKTIELVDKDFGKRNKLLPREISDIAEDGLFQIHVCVECGFKLITNPYKASTSQLRTALLSHNIRLIKTCGQEELDDLIADLVPMLSKEEAARICGETLDEQKLSFMSVLNDYLEDCKLEDLVDAYNTLSCEDVEEAFFPQPSDNEDLPKDPLKFNEVVADD